MSVDWTKYPVLPEPAKLPPWRDTPEREACWWDLCEKKSGFQRRFGCSIGMVSFLLFGGGIFYFALSFRMELSVLLFIVFFILDLVCVFLTGWTIEGIFTLPMQLRIMKKHKTYMRSLKRPDFSRQVGAILAARPTWSAEEFCRLWPTEEHSRMALKFLKILARYRRSSGKMLYPNDSAFFFLYGKIFLWSRYKICFPPEDFYADVEDELGFPEEKWTERNFESVILAEIVEHCLKTAEERHE